MTEQKIFELGLKKRNKQITDKTWQNLVDEFSLPFVNGEYFREWVRHRIHSVSPIDKELDKVEYEQKERYKIRNEKRKIGSILSKQALREQLCESLVESAKIIAKDYPIVGYSHYPSDSHKTGILQISDWHYALAYENRLNTYDKDVFKQRINNLITGAIDRCEDEHIEKLVVAVQNDLISGNIHGSLRALNQDDLVSQIMYTSEVLCQVITELNRHFDVDLDFVIDNHSRASANRDDSTDYENYSRITQWYARERFKNVPNVKFLDNNFSLDIGNFDVYGYKVGVVHGHDDRLNRIVQNLTSYTRQIYDVILVSHFHHPFFEEQEMTNVFCNGSLCGIDQYSNSKRRSSKPSQNLIIIKKDYGVYNYYPIYV